MFDNYVWSDCKVRPIGGGFDLNTLITYYRGIPLSMIHDIQVIVDGQPVPRVQIQFSPNGEDFFGLDEMATVTSYRWEYGDEGIVRVLMPLAKGEHEITLKQATRVAYIPVPFGGERTAKVMVS